MLSGAVGVPSIESYMYLLEAQGNALGLNSGTLSSQLPKHLGFY